MNEFGLVGDITLAGGVAMLLVELIKKIVRLQKPGFEFPQPLLAFLDVVGFEMPTDWVGWLKGVVVTLLVSLVAVGGYGVTIGKYKETVGK